MNINTVASHFSKSKLAIALSASLALIGCGGSGQDDGSVSGSSTTYSGKAIDGYLARATVYLDSNNNGTRDPWEAWAFTDNEGYYSYNPNTEINYCASDATPQQQQYCLNTNIAHDNVVIRIDSGYDVLTGEPFIGQLSRRVNARNESEITGTVITPITTLLSNVEAETDRNTLLTSLSITNDDLNIDYLNTDGSGGVNAPLLNTALKIHKTVSILSDRLTDTYENIGKERGTPNDATSVIYPKLAEQIISAGNNLNTVLTNSNNLVSVLDAAENSLRKVYEQKELDLPTDMGSLGNANSFTRITNITNNIPNVVDRLIDRNALNFDQADARGGARALETLLIKTVNEPSNSDDSSIDNMFAFFNNGANNTLISTLTTSLSQPRADISSLSLNDFSGDNFDSDEDMENASTLPVDALPFSVIGGKQIKISDLDLGTAPSDLEDKELEIYFNGEASDLEGSFTACVKYIDGASSDGSLGDGNTRGELVEGFWSLLGASEIDQQSYSLLMTITFLGTTYQTIMKPSGEVTIDSTLYKKVRFDFDGDLATFHSEDGIVDIDEVPTSNSACAARLPSRVGI